MARVTEQDLRAYVEAGAGSSLQPYIDDAHLLVNETLALGDYSFERLALIEKALAAHLFVLAREKGGISLERIQDAEVRHTLPQGLGLRSTRFGNLVLTYDTSGAFEALSVEKKKAGFRVM